MKKFLLSTMILFGVMSATFAQRTITGSLTDTDGEPLIGASILVKGTTVGTVTDLDGSYSISVPADAEVLVFSYTGFDTQEVRLGVSNVLDVTLDSAIEQLSEVVVVGYGTQIKSELTGNIVNVKAEQIENIPVASVELALQGKTPGVVVEGLNGKPGQATRIRIRGASSITASNQPLIVIDGVPMTTTNLSGGVPLNPLADINTNDIASIDVLKDASAAAIYGSRGANGVIIITTKSGQAGATKVDVNFQVGMSEPSGRREWLNAPEYIEYLSEAARNLDADEGNTPDDFTWINWIEDRFDRYSGPSDWRSNQTDTNWEDLAFRDNAGFFSTDVNVSGGTNLFNYYVSAAHTKQDGILVGNGFERSSVRTNLNGNSADSKFKYGLSVGLSRTVNNRVSNDNAFSTPLQLIAQAPITPVRNETDATYEGTDPGELFDRPVNNYYNGLIHIEDAENTTTIIRTLANSYLSYELTPGLSIRGEFGLDNSDLRSDQFFGRRTNTGDASNGLGFAQSSRVFNFTTKVFANYLKSFGSSNLDLTLGSELQRSISDRINVEGQQFPVDDLKTIASAAEITAGDGFSTNFSFLSYFGRLNYNFDRKYLLTLSSRIDGSSRFGADNRYGFFPAVGLGWVISNEDFFGQNGAISFLKLRGSWGLTGNAEIGNFGSLGLYDGEGYNGIAGLQPSQIANPNLGWEETSQIDVGIDFGFFNNRLNGEIDYYKKNTNDLLLNVPVPSTSGFTSQLQNIGKVENSGFEFILNSVNTTGAFKWTTSINGAFNTNEVTELADGQTLIDGTNAVEIGEPLAFFRGAEYAGVDPANGDALFYKNTKDDQGNIIDRSTTNDFSEATFVNIGNPTPDFVGGLSNTFEYAGVSLSFTLQVALGQQINNTAGRFQESPGWFDNQSKSQLNYWRQPGDITNIPRLVWFGGNGDQARNSRYIQDGDFLKMRDITLSYRFPAGLIRNLNLRNVRVYLSARNLFTLTGYDGWDPEVTNDAGTTATGVSNINIGNDFYSAPQPRVYTFGLNVGF